MIGVLRAEALKLSRRPALAVCLLAMVALLAGLSYAILWAVYSHPPPTLPSALPRGISLEQLKSALHPIHLHQALVSFCAQLGAAVAIIVGVLSVGSEYGWGTFKMLFTQRPARLTVVVAKLAMLAAAMLVCALVLLATAVVASSLIALLDGVPLTFPATSEIARAGLASWLILTVWAFFGALLAFAFRQAALAIGLGLVYHLVVESIVLGLLASAGADSLHKALQWLPVAATTNLSQSFGAATGRATMPVLTGTQAVLALIAYGLAFAIASGIFIRARDVS